MNRLASAIVRVHAGLAVLLAWPADPVLAQVQSLVGRWTWTRPVNKCTETYVYRRDGTFTVTSGKEVASGRYEVSGTPDDNGFFTLTGRTLRTNGGRDCSDAGSTATELAKPYTVYVAFHRTEPMHLVCYEATLENCFGPLRRVGK
ncbi:MAG: hypothetical protein JNM90_00765 [Burkholderiales bacterium]|nr:hypothetical protein [Burkholderiales bacterium]